MGKEIILSGIEKDIRMLVKDEMKKENNKLKREDADLIIQAIADKMDEIIAEKVKQHFLEIGEFIKKNAKGE